MNLYRAAIFAALFLCFAVPPVGAQDVTLTSRDGKVEIVGTLLGFDGEFYRVETKFGELTIDSSGVLCDGPGCPSLTNYVAEVVFSGSSTMAEVLLPALVEGFALRNRYLTRRTALAESQFEYSLLDAGTSEPVARFTFRVSNTDQGFSDLLANEADVVMALREIRTDERKRAYEAGMGDMTGRNRSRVLALDAMVPVVAPDNPLQRISTPELARVFAGQITNWSELGGPDAPIALHLSAIGSGLAQAVEDRLLVVAVLGEPLDLLALDRLGLGAHLVVREVPGQAADHLDLFAEIEIHRVSSYSEVVPSGNREASTSRVCSRCGRATNR